MNNYKLQLFRRCCHMWVCPGAYQNSRICSYTSVARRGIYHLFILLSGRFLVRQL